MNASHYSYSPDPGSLRFITNHALCEPIPVDCAADTRESKVTVQVRNPLSKALTPNVFQNSLFFGLERSSSCVYVVYYKSPGGFRAVTHNQAH